MSIVFVIVAHPDDEILGCGATILKHIDNGDKVYVLFVSEGVSGRYKNKKEKKCLNEIVKREEMAKKAAKIGKYKIIDFLRLKNLELGSYSHNYLTNIIIKYFIKYKPDIVYTHFENDLNIDHYHTFFSTFVASRPNSKFKIQKLLSFEIPSSTDWGTSNKIFIPNYFIDTQKYQKKKIQLLNQYKYEMRNPPHPRSIKNINALSIYRGGIVGLKQAEAFFLHKLID